MMDVVRLTDLEELTRYRALFGWEFRNAHEFGPWIVEQVEDWLTRQQLDTPTVSDLRRVIDTVQEFDLVMDCDWVPRQVEATFRRRDGDLTVVFSIGSTHRMKAVCNGP